MQMDNTPNCGRRVRSCARWSDDAAARLPLRPGCPRIAGARAQPRSRQWPAHVSRAHCPPARCQPRPWLTRARPRAMNHQASRRVGRLRPGHHRRLREQLHLQRCLHPPAGGADGRALLRGGRRQGRLRRPHSPDPAARDSERVLRRPRRPRRGRQQLLHASPRSCR